MIPKWLRWRELDREFDERDARIALKLAEIRKLLNIPPISLSD